MIQLSVNVNKIATLRNSRGGDHPSMEKLSRLILDSGAHGLTVHPREDERHIKTSDLLPLRKLLDEYFLSTGQRKEYNLEGEPSERFLRLLELARPEQATFVPVTPGEITSDHGFSLETDAEKIQPFVKRAKDMGMRVSLFLDPGARHLSIAKEIGADRIELYTGPFAHAFDRNPNTAKEIFFEYEQTARNAIAVGLEINAGHDLDHENLVLFSQLPALKEVSIGHRLISTSLELGLEKTIQLYLKALGTKTE